MTTHTASVAISGYAQLTHGLYFEKSFAELANEAVSQALDHVAITLDVVERIYLSSVTGQTITRSSDVGAYLRDRLGFAGEVLSFGGLETGSIRALQQAGQDLAAGLCQTAVVLSVEQVSVLGEEALQTLLATLLDPDEVRQGLTYLSAFGLLADDYLQRYNLTGEVYSRVSSYAHSQAVLNKYAYLRRALEKSPIEASALIADPLRQLHEAPLVDGAAALVLQTQPPRGAESWTIGTAISQDKPQLAKRKKLSSFLAVREAFTRLSVSTGLHLGQFTHLEVDDTYAVTALMSLESLGLAAPGQAPNWFDPEGIPSSIRSLNRSGGRKAGGNVLTVAPLGQIVSLLKQLGPDAPRSQGLAIAVGGCGQEAAATWIRRGR